MYSDKFQNYLQTQLNDLEEQGLFKKERIIASPQSAEITLENGKTLLNFCANNYLGLSDNKDVISASQKMLDDRGYGMSSVRFICGTQDVHKQLEKKIANFLGMEDTILYAAAFDANGGVFEPFFTTQRNGTGMGLFIARDLCEINQARLSLIKTKKGCSFAITLNSSTELLI